MDGVGLLLLLLFFALIAVLSGTGRSRRDAILRRQSDAHLNESLYRSVRTDATGMLTCRRCGTESSEQAGSCPRCGASL